LKQKIFLFIALAVSGLFRQTDNILAYTSEQLTVSLGQPESPTTQNNFKLTFVAVDKDPNADIAVGCYKKSSSDNDFVKFDTDKRLIPGGNTDFCVVDNSILNVSGSYFFKITAITSTETKESNIVSVDFTAPSASPSILGAATNIGDDFNWWLLLLIVPGFFIFKKATQKK